ncbi:dihydrofolate reductase family protein [Glycomyces scopariae]
MRKVVLFMLSSLDGGVEHPARYFPEGDGDGAPVFDPVTAGMEAHMTASQDAVLMGRKTYDEWSYWWPRAEDEPFAEFINPVRKYVFTSTPLAREWTNAEPVADPVPDFVRALKETPGGDIGVHGSITLAQTLLHEELVDEINLAVGRVLFPEGRRLFTGLEGPRELDLVRAIPTPTGSLWLTYRPHQ